MLRILQFEEIANLLLQLPDLARQHERRSTEFSPQAGTWLSALENAMAGSRLHQAGTIAVLRSELAAVEQGLLPAGLTFRGRPTRGRVLNAAISQALRRAAEVASSLLAEHQPRLAEAELIAQRMVSAARSRGLIVAREAGINNTQYLHALRRGFVDNVDLENAFVHLEGLVGPHDALVLFDRALPPLAGHAASDIPLLSLPIPDRTTVHQ